MRQHEQAQDRKGQRQDPTEAYLSAKPAPHASNTIYQLPFSKLQSNDCEHLAMSDPLFRVPPCGAAARERCVLHSSQPRTEAHLERKYVVNFVGTPGHSGAF